MAQSKHEPKAGTRQAATEIYGLYVALVDSGFTEAQALTIVGHMLSGRKET